MARDRPSPYDATGATSEGEEQALALRSRVVHSRKAKNMPSPYVTTGTISESEGQTLRTTSLGWRGLKPRHLRQKAVLASQE